MPIDNFKPPYDLVESVMRKIFPYVSKRCLQGVVVCFAKEIKFFLLNCDNLTVYRSLRNELPPELFKMCRSKGEELVMIYLLFLLAEMEKIMKNKSIHGFFNYHCKCLERFKYLKANGLIKVDPEKRTKRILR